MTSYDATPGLCRLLLGVVLERQDCLSVRTDELTSLRGEAAEVDDARSRVNVSQG